MELNELIKEFDNLSAKEKALFKNHVKEETKNDQYFEKLYQSREIRLKTAEKENQAELDKIEKEIKNMLKHASVEINWYLKHATLDGRPVTVFVRGLRFNNNGIDCFFENYCGPVVIKYYKKDGFFIENRGKPCTSLRDQYKAVKNLIDCLDENNEHIIEMIDFQINRMLEYVENRDRETSCSHYKF